MAGRGRRAAELVVDIGAGGQRRDREQRRRRADRPDREARREPIQGQLTDRTVSEWPARSQIRKTLPGAAYHSEETWALDKERVFYRNWIYVGRAERVARPGAWLRVEIADESILVVRGKDDQLRAFYNVCRHRGSRICDEESGEVRTHLRCPYHAWGYALDGTLVTTPMIEKDEIDRESTSLWPVHLDVWEGFVFVNLSREEPRPLLEHLADQMDDPLALARFGLADLRIGHVTTNEVPANWKIVIENYNECLHCPTIHPELVAVVPAYKKGGIFEDGRDDGGVSLADGRTAIVDDPRLRLPLLPGFKKDGRSRVLLRRARLPDDVPRRRRLQLPGHRGVPDRSAELPAGDRVPLQPRGPRGPRLRPVAGRGVQRAGDRPGQRGLRASPARRDVTGLRPRRLPGQGRLGLRVRPALPARRRGPPDHASVERQHS